MEPPAAPIAALAMVIMGLSLKIVIRVIFLLFRLAGCDVYQRHTTRIFRNS